MGGEVAVDSGPLVALFNATDAYHAKALAWARTFTGRLVSNAVVVTEVVYLLDVNSQVQSDFLLWIGRGGMGLIELTAEDRQRCAQIMVKYADLPAVFADASLLAQAERLGLREVASIDRDFDVYRLKNRLRNIFPRS